MADNQPSVQQNTFLTAEAYKQIITNLNSTLWFGMIAGLLGILGYSWNVEKIGWKLMYLFILLAAASYICGFFLGFLFGIPKRNNDSESAYNLSTNLVDISDWLTKIIIGLGLIEIKKIPEYLQSIGNYIQKSVGGEDSVKIFSVCCIIYFSIFGLYYGYNYMRLFLSGQFKNADDNLLQKQQRLSEKAEALNKINFTPSASSAIDSYATKDLSEYDQLLTSTKTADNYTFEDWYFKGVKAYNDNDFNKAITYMENALEKNKKEQRAPEAYLYMALSYERLNLFEKGIEIYNYAITQYPEYAHMYLLHNNKAVILYKNENYTEALKENEKSLNLNDSYDNAYSLKGAILAKINRRDEAMEALNKAALLNDTSEITFYNLACLYALRNDKENMLANLKKAVDLKKEDTKMAKTDPDFTAFWNDPDFLNLMG